MSSSRVSATDQQRPAPDERPKAAASTPARAAGSAAKPSAIGQLGPEVESRRKAAARILATGAIRVAAAELAAKSAVSETPRQLDEVGAPTFQHDCDIDCEDESTGS